MWLLDVMEREREGKGPVMGLARKCRGTWAALVYRWSDRRVLG